MTTDERSAEQSAEAQVRAYWKQVFVWKAEPTTDSLSDCGDWYVDLLNSGNEKHGAYTFPAPTKSAAWDAALAFTLEHQRKVAELEASERWLLSLYYIPDRAAHAAALKLVRAALSELKRGVKEKM